MIGFGRVKGIEDNGLVGGRVQVLALRCLEDDARGRAVGSGVGRTFLDQVEGLRRLDAGDRELVRCLARERARGNAHHQQQADPEGEDDTAVTEGPASESIEVPSHAITPCGESQWMPRAGRSTPSK